MNVNRWFRREVSAICADPSLITGAVLIRQIKGYDSTYALSVSDSVLLTVEIDDCDAVLIWGVSIDTCAGMLTLIAATTAAEIDEMMHHVRGLDLSVIAKRARELSGASSD